MYITTPEQSIRTQWISDTHEVHEGHKEAEVAEAVGAVPHQDLGPRSDLLHRTAHVSDARGLRRFLLHHLVYLEGDKRDKGVPMATMQCYDDC